MDVCGKGSNTEKDNIENILAQTTINVEVGGGADPSRNHPLCSF
jgi:phosphoribosylformimino-5-aminoimidazole carboxamide ribonucleotide (ProFAR) isomerase